MLVKQIRLPPNADAIDVLEQLHMQERLRKVEEVHCLEFDET
jgi:hypothetical protein